jgi:hypothetical protein
LGTQFKTFHFKEINLFISFPVGANAGKYAEYMVFVTDGRDETSSKKAKLHEILEFPSVDRNFPHTVGYFKMSSAGSCPEPEYLELREIRTVEELWAFLNAVNL